MNSSGHQDITVQQDKVGYVDIDYNQQPSNNIPFATADTSHLTVKEPHPNAPVPQINHNNVAHSSYPPQNIISPTNRIETKGKERQCNYAQTDEMKDVVSKLNEIVGILHHQFTVHDSIPPKPTPSKSDPHQQSSSRRKSNQNHSYSPEAIYRQNYNKSADNYQEHPTKTYHQRHSKYRNSPPLSPPLPPPQQQSHQSRHTRVPYYNNNPYNYPYNDDYYQLSHPQPPPHLQPPLQSRLQPQIQPQIQPQPQRRYHQFQQQYQYYPELYEDDLDDGIYYQSRVYERQRRKSFGNLQDYKLQRKSSRGNINKQQQRIPYDYEHSYYNPHHQPYPDGYYR